MIKETLPLNWWCWKEHLPFTFLTSVHSCQGGTVTKPGKQTSPYKPGSASTAHMRPLSFSLVGDGVPAPASVHLFSTLKPAAEGPVPAGKGQRLPSCFAWTGLVNAMQGTATEKVSWSLVQATLSSPAFPAISCYFGFLFLHLFLSLPGT